MIGMLMLLIQLPADLGKRWNRGCGDTETISLVYGPGGVGRMYVHSKYDKVCLQLYVTHTFFRSTRAESGRFRILRSHSPLRAAIFAWQRSTLHTEGY